MENREESCIFLVEVLMGQNLKIETKQHFLTGIPGIDDQHKGIFLIIDTLLDSLKEKSLSSDSVRTTIHEILGNLKSHFSTEEKLMEMVGFSKVKEHKALHKNFLNMLAEELKNHKHADYEKIGHFVHTLRSSVFTHISIFDRDYVDFVEDLLTARKKFNITALKAQAVAG